MKYLLFVLFLIAVLITAGCVNQNNGVVAPTQPTTPLPSDTITTITQPQTIVTVISKDEFVMPTRPEDVTELNMNRVLMDCKDVNNLGSYHMGYSTSPVCVKAYDLYVSANKHYPPNPYEASVSTILEQQACAEGRLTDLEYCAKIGVTFDKNGNYRINISKMNY